jgi:hypothetical protein
MPRRSRTPCVTDRWTRLHPLPPDSSKHSVSIEEGKGEGAESCDWHGRDSPCPRDHLARQATEPAPHASRTHATPLTPSARVTSPWPRGSTHWVPTTLTPPTVCRIRFWHHPIRIMPLLLTLAPAKVASRPSMPSDCHRTVRLAMGEHGYIASPHAEPQPFPSCSSSPWWHPTRATPPEKTRGRKGGAGVGRIAKDLIGARRGRRSATSMYLLGTALQ